MAGEYREILPEQLLSIPRLASKLGLPRRTLSRQLLALHASKGGTWLVRDGRTWRVNMSRLEAEHPNRFRPRTLDERLTALEGSTAARFDEHEDRLTSVERRLNRIG